MENKKTKLTISGNPKKSFKDFGISQMDIIQLLHKEGKSALPPNISRDLKKLESRKLLIKKGKIYFPVV